MSLTPRAVVVHRPTEYEELIARHGTKGHAAFFLSSRGRSVEEVERRYALQLAAMTAVTSSLPMDWRRGVRHDGVDVGPWMVLAWQSERIRLRRAARHHAARASSTAGTDGATRPRAHRHRANHFDRLRTLLPAVPDHDYVKPAALSGEKTR